MRLAGRVFHARFHIVAGDNIMLHSVETRRFIAPGMSGRATECHKKNGGEPPSSFGNVHAAR
ncbi:hypothetical protein T281_01715 [Rhodomicrobium udaipurense JA643]|nr:hypothetical protein T281_01715 [Rhodomicrobium udaipurense JA643]